MKLGLFVVLLALAALNRLALTERLAGIAPDAARRHMRTSIATETVLGTLVVITAGFLASHAPGTHEQPIWPFARRPSVSVLYQPELRGEVIAALVATGASVIIAIIGVIWRKARWPGLALAAIILALAIPHLDLLFIQAYPTTFFTSPTELRRDSDSARRKAICGELRRLPWLRGTWRRPSCEIASHAPRGPDGGTLLGAQRRRAVLVYFAWLRGAERSHHHARFRRRSLRARRAGT